MTYWKICLILSIIQIILAVSHGDFQHVIIGIFMLIITRVVHYLEEELI